MFQDLEPWRTVVRREVLTNVNNEWVVTESLMRMTNRNLDLLELDDNTVTKEAFPIIHRFVEDRVLPRMRRYLSDQYALVDTNDSYNAWVRVTTGGEGMKLHEHSGAVLSAIYYPIESKGAINLVDPRGSACRGYPTTVRNKYFNLFSEDPSEGLLLIYPSYLQHYVDGHSRGMRVSIPVDIYLNESR